MKSKTTFFFKQLLESLLKCLHYISIYVWCFRKITHNNNNKLESITLSICGQWTAVRFENSRRKSLYDRYYCCGYCSGRATTGSFSLPLEYAETKSQPKQNKKKLTNKKKKKKETYNQIQGNDSNNNNHNIWTNTTRLFGKSQFFLSRPSRAKGRLAVEVYVGEGSGPSVGVKGAGCSEAARNCGRAWTAWRKQTELRDVTGAHISRSYNCPKGPTDDKSILQSMNQPKTCAYTVTSENWESSRARNKYGILVCLSKKLNYSFFFGVLLVNYAV